MDGEQKQSEFPQKVLEYETKVQAINDKNERFKDSIFLAPVKPK